MVEDLLKAIGLSDNEVKVYLSLLKLGPSHVNALYEDTGIHRRNIYDVLNKLIEKGLVIYIMENKKRAFQAKNPERLLTYLEERKNIIEAQKENIRNKIPELLSRFEHSKPSIEAEVYRGDEGIKSLVDETLSCKEILFIGSRAYIMERYPHYWAGYNKKRIKLRIKWKGVSVHEMRGHRITREKTMNFRFLPKELTGPPNVIWIFGDTVANIVWTSTPIAFVIRDRNVAESYRRYFNFLWRKIAKD